MLKNTELEQRKILICCAIEYIFRYPDDNVNKKVERVIIQIYLSL